MQSLKIIIVAALITWLVIMFLFESGILERFVFKHEPWTKKNRRYVPQTAYPVQLSVGQTGIALTPLRPCGKVELGGQKVDVISKSNFIEKNTDVKILSLEGNHIVVTACSEST